MYSKIHTNEFFKKQIFSNLSVKYFSDLNKKFIQTVSDITFNLTTERMKTEFFGTTMDNESIQRFTLSGGGLTGRFIN